ncbi:DUF3892 domain-containing protein [Oecophyllibacter saccharovorans]|uniref:DUF3892 domain-containing protein n=1 Tax=Oecophyllibacter saccharovorans TaxID=2558360 RepID=UPI0011720213|nr:DUF3892 domain-containing protein [Oecophyllibacter saccharovorans]TPW35082.1 DUF3892 domain-containing protein [Oecophyllibacter saccharovorans]
MAMALEIKCINKSSRQDAHSRINHIGGINSNGGRWTLSEEEAIQGIKTHKYDFYTNAGGKKAKVVIATHEGREYLKTENDKIQPNNLLSLPECP